MEKDTTRTEAFSDGIFAVAITLLALEIGIDVKEIESHHSLAATTNEELVNQLKALWPKVFAFFNSFAAILLMWMAHHQVFKFLRTTSNKLILVNGLLLLIIALVPFPTKTVGEFIQTDAVKTAVVFYTGYSVIVAAAFVLLITVAAGGNGHLLLLNVNVEQVATFNKSLWTGLLLNIAIFIIAFFSPLTGMALNFCMWIFWAITAEVRSKEMIIGDLKT